MVRPGAPCRAAAKRCAFHTEQKSLQRTFETIGARCPPIPNPPLSDVANLTCAQWDEGRAACVACSASADPVTDQLADPFVSFPADPSIIAEVLASHSVRTSHTLALETDECIHSCIARFRPRVLRYTTTTHPRRIHASLSPRRRRDRLTLQSHRMCAHSFLLLCV